MNDQTVKPTDQRPEDMDTSNFEFRLHRLEQAFDGEKIPYRMQAVEIGLAQIQGEVVALKEIARGIGTKVDSGIRELSTDNTRNQAFMKAALWFGGVAISIISPLIVLLAQELLKKAS